MKSGRNAMLAAVVFDFDGIIVDTEPLHYKAFQEVLAPFGYGYSWDEYLRTYIGFDDRDAFRETFRVARRDLTPEDLSRLIDKKAEAFQHAIASGVEPYPGVVELVRSIAGNMPLALCSGALPSDILPIVKKLGIADAFDVIVTAADVSASKPDPESYALTVRKLSAAYPVKAITPAGCLAIEDTPAGIASAAGAGLKVIAVTNSYPAERLGNAFRVVSSLSGIDLDGLKLLL
jgi:HAD superfamily hydrolase (TIGR01509 family)